MSRPEIEPSSIPLGRRRLYAILVLLIPVAALIVGELLARVFVAPPASLFQEQTINGIVYRSIDPAVTARYFPTLAVQPGTGTDLFRAQKAPGTIRIFALGESSTLGYPYMVNGSFPAMLRDRLRRQFPDRTIEVVNLGVTAVTTHTVLDVTRWCVDEDPDLLIVYAGHNEYYGALGVGSSQFVGSARWMVRTYLALHRSRLFVALKGAVAGISESMASENRTGTLMELMARRSTIPLGSATYERGLSTFQENLEAIASAVAEKVPVVMCTLVSNLGDLPPLESVEPAEWTAAQRAELPKALRAADSLVSIGDLGAAKSQLDVWSPAESTHAGLAFHRGAWSRARGEFHAADSWYRRARDLDGIRFRAPSTFNEVIRSFAGRPGVFVADVESVMVSRSPGRIIGREFLLEHVHPNISGYAVIADAVQPSVLAALASRGLSAETRDSPPIPPFITRVDSLVADFRIRILVNSWPFTSKGVTISDLRSSGWEEELALAYLRKDFTWEVLHVRAAERYEAEGRLSAAASEYRALIAATPYNVSPFLRLGVVRQKQSDLVGAYDAFERSLPVERTTTALLKLGEIAYETGRHAQTIRYLTEALTSGRLEPGRVPEIRLAIAVAAMRGGDVARARQMTESLVAEYPEFERGRAFLDYLVRTSEKEARK